MMIYDHNRNNVSTWAEIILADPEAAKYVDGVAFHWYTGGGYNNLTITHNTNPDKFILATEGFFF